jgi:hypothetical protein
MNRRLSQKPSTHVEQEKNLRVPHSSPFTTLALVSFSFLFDSIGLESGTLRPCICQATCSTN